MVLWRIVNQSQLGFDSGALPCGVIMHLIYSKIANNSYQHYSKGRSQTKLTIFCPLFPPPLLTFTEVREDLHTVNTSISTYLPRLVNVVFECPLVSSCIISYNAMWRSQTTLTSFWLFLTTYPPSLTFSTL